MKIDGLWGSRRFLVAAFGLVACGLMTAPAGAQAVKVGHLGIVADGPYYIAIEKGYFKEQNIEVTLERFISGAKVTAPLSTNQLQAAGGGLSAGLFNAFARDWPVRIAMARTRDIPGYSSDTLIVREDLKVTSLADLKGKKIAVNSSAGVLHYMVGRMMETVGMSIKDVEIVFMTWPNMGPALETKAIDVGAVVEPFALLYKQRGLATPFKRAADVLVDPPLEVSVILFNKDWMDQKPEQALGFTTAYLKGMRDYYEAMIGGPNRSQVIEILVKYTSLKKKSLYDQIQWSYMDPNAELSLASLRDQQDWYAAQGALKKKIEIESMIDRRYLDQALQKLGRVEPRR